MSARAFLNVVHSILVEIHGHEAVYEFLNPPTREEKLARRRAELVAAGFL